MAGLLAAVAVCVPAVAAPAAAAAAPASATPATRVLFHFQDPRIDEASGIAVGVRSPSVDYVQNDSGDTNRVFAVNARTGATAATITVRGARNVDWEDIATAPDAAGKPSIWLADTGDNDSVRRDVQIYRIPEPRIDPRAHGGARVVPVDATWRLRYPDGPTDAESLAVAPDGAAFIVTKSVTGTSTVYQVPGRPSASRVQTMRPIGSVGFMPAGRPNPFGVAGELLATGAALSADGSRFVVRTYAAAYLWPVRGGDLAQALRSRPVPVTLPRERQGEGIAFDGSRLIVDSEGRGSAVESVALPRLPRPGRAPATPTDPVTTAGSAATSPGADGTPAAPSRSPGPGHAGGGSFSVAAGVVLLVLIAVSLAFRQRRRRRPPDDPEP